ncbi:MAG: ribosome biogenesis GTP-binding protein YihA/YsxC [Candidatus Hydrogenedentes bacterium]|nr:ribosome biogenesis GTP-binding protein YihA/YsxC [Candidatus Hydrogenedentota bacterium]
MKVLSAGFVKSALRPEQYPRDGRPEIAFVGRSNVGKSTMLNILLNKKGLAKTSKTPGKTQTVNFFDVNGNVYFVDLPGYGYAKVGKSLREEWAKVLTSYLTSQRPLRLVVALVDSRHKPAGQDFDMLELLEQAQVPTLIVATKADKQRPNELAESLCDIRKTLDIDSDALLVPFSALTKAGLRDIWNVVDDALRTKTGKR